MIRILVNAAGKPEIPVPVLERGVRVALEEEGVQEGEVSVTLLDDEEIRAMNNRFLERDRSTDVIAFRLHDDGEPLLGDVYLGLEVARREAEARGISLREELVRLAIHGTLHVLGHEHPEGPEREESPMYRLQEELVARVLSGDGAGSGPALPGRSDEPPERENGDHGEA